MATERDDAVSRRYRELAREEPGGHLDAAILAASRRAVGARPGGVRRWAGPVSIAAVLVLGIGVSLRMQMEQPGIESAVPQAPPQQALPPQVQPALPEDKAEGVITPPAEIATKPLQKKVAPAAPRKPEAFRAGESERRVAPATVPAFTPPPPAAAPMPQAQPAPEPPRADAPPAARGFAADAVAPAAPQRAKREAANIAEPPEAELERIAKLRADGRHEEADRALEEFRRRHPDYRIPEAMWERVRPRP